MDAKAEKMALFRYRHAPLVLETLPRGELMQRKRSPLGTMRSPAPNGLRFPLISCCTGPGVTARVVSKPWLPNLGRIVEPFRAITPQLAELIERLKGENPYRTGTTLLRELALGSGSDSCSLAPATLYRFLKQRRLSTRQLLAAPAHKKVSGRV